MSFTTLSPLNHFRFISVFSHLIFVFSVLFDVPLCLIVLTPLSFPFLLTQLLERREALFKKSEVRPARLEEAYRYHAFERDADETKSWINEKLKIARD